MENDGGVHLPDDSENTSAFIIGDMVKDLDSLWIPECQLRYTSGKIP